MPQSIGKYQIESILGRGGMGVVYKGVDPFIGRTVAIKTIVSSELGTDDDLIARLRMEAKSAGRLTHPNIVTVFEFGEHGPLTYLVMEYVEGANLANVIASGVHLSLNTKIEIIIQLADGISYAHGLGVIHRDIKPSNICLTKRGDPKILDFGLARFDETRLTKTGLTSGTLMYMSPERMRGQSGPSDDIFALGAVAYEIITGKRAFPGEGYRDTVRNIMSGEYPIPPSRVVDVPSDLDIVIAKATAVDQAHRYQSASDFARAVRDVQQSQTFQRRAQLDGTSVVESMQTVAVNFNLQNPYTAPDMRAGSAVHASGGPRTGPGHVVQPPEEPLDRTDTMPVHRAAPAPASADSGVQPTIAMTSVDFSEGTAGRSGGESGYQPTVGMTSPDFSQQTVESAAATEMMSAPHLPARGAAPDAMMYAPTEAVVVPARALVPPTEARTGPAATDAPGSAAPNSLIGRTRTVVARVMKKVKSGGTKVHRGPATALAGADRPFTPGVVKPSAAPAAKPRLPMTTAEKVAVYGSAAVLAGAVAAAGTAAANGAIALICVYAGAIAAWHFLVRNCGNLSGRHAAVIAAGLTLAALVQGGVVTPVLSAELEAGRAVAAQAMPAGGPLAPYAALLFTAWAVIGGASIFRALLAVIAILTIGWTLWDRERPARSMAVVTFPLLLIEGVVFARVEALAAMLLVGAFFSIFRRRFGVAGFLSVAALGLATPAIAALPVLYGAAWHIAVFLAAVVVAFVVPKLLWPGVPSWWGSLGALTATSPLLLFLNSRVAAMLTDWGVVGFLGTLSLLVTERAGIAPRPVVATVLATVVLVIALFVVISIIAARASSVEGALADGIGILLLLCMVREPAAWLLVAPFAMLGNRSLWLFLAIGSPILLLAPADAQGALTVWMISAAIPFAAFVVLAAVKRQAPVAAPPPLPT